MSTDINDDRTCLTSEEQELLQKNNALRAQLIAKLTTSESGALQVPGSTSDKVLLQALLADSDKIALSKAKLRISNKAAESNKDFREMAAAILMSQNIPRRRAATPEERKLPDDVKPEGVTKGEMAIGVENFTIQQIMGSQK